MTPLFPGLYALVVSAVYCLYRAHLRRGLARRRRLLSKRVARLLWEAADRLDGAPACCCPPRGEEAPSPARAAGGPLPTRLSRGRSILVVEDDATTREALALALEADGYQTARAANGRDALDLLRQGPAPDLIVLDLMMPVLDGWQFRLRQRADAVLAAIPVVVVSADGDLPRRADSLGAAAVLEKPVEPGRLVDAVRPLVAGPRPAGPWWDGGSLSPEEREPLTLSLRSRAEVPAALDTVAGAMQGQGFPPRDVFAVRLALGEALVNAVRHGQRDAPAKEVRVRYRVTAEQALVEVEGTGLVLAGGPGSPSAEGPDRPSRRGPRLTRHFLSWVRHDGKGNCVTLCQRRSRG
jgi:CheY-like chemotaxis protein